MVAGSKVSACHISSWLMAVLGMKLHPTGQRCAWYHSFALAADQRGEATSCRRPQYAPSRACQPFANRGWRSTGGRRADCACACAMAEALHDPVRR